MWIKIKENLTEKYYRENRHDTGFSIFVLVIVLLLTAFMALNTFVFFHVLVEGPSMQPTLYTGDVLVANSRKQVKHGSIIIVDGEKKVGNQYVWLIKRAIALEGDTIQITGGKVYVNGEELDEPYLADGMETTKYPGNYPIGDSVYTLKENEVYYLGDNRVNSADSRMYGVCDISQIEGVVENWSLNMRGFNGFIYKIRLFFTGGLKKS